MTESGREEEVEHEGRWKRRENGIVHRHLRRKVYVMGIEQLNKAGKTMRERLGTVEDKE